MNKEEIPNTNINEKDEEQKQQVNNDENNVLATEIKDEDNDSKTNNINTEYKIDIPDNNLININELNQKQNSITNSEVMLTLFEITTNSKCYGLNSSNKSRHFWNQLVEIPQLSKVLDAYKSETLRKYWRLISEISTNDKIIEVIKNNEDAINNTSMKLLTIITVIKDYLLGKIKDIEKHLIEAPDRNAIKPNNYNSLGNNKKANKNTGASDDESFNIEDELKNLNKNYNQINGNNKALLNKKTKISKNEASGVLINNNDSININNNYNNEANEDNTYKKSLRPKKKQKMLFNEEDKNIFSQIEIILNTFKNQFPELSECDIYDALKKNSFNVISTYCYLVDTEENEGI